MGEKSSNLPINFQIYRVPGSPKKIETCFQDGSSMIFTSERAEVRLKNQFEKLVPLSFLTHASSYCSFAKRARRDIFA